MLFTLACLVECVHRFNLWQCVNVCQVISAETIRCFGIIHDFTIIWFVIATFRCTTRIIYFKLCLVKNVERFQRPFYPTLTVRWLLCWRQVFEGFDLLSRTIGRRRNSQHRRLAPPYWKETDQGDEEHHWDERPIPAFFIPETDSVILPVYVTWFIFAFSEIHSMRLLFSCIGSLWFLSLREFRWEFLLAATA